MTFKSHTGISWGHTFSIVNDLDKSFARIFYRNAINIGLPVIVCKELPDAVNTGDEMELSLTEGVARANGSTYSCTKLPAYMQQILSQGGLIASLNKEEA